MPALQVRDFPADLYEELRVYAERNHRSIAQQTIACVEKELARSKQPTAIHDNANALDPEFGALPNDDIQVPANVQEASRRARSIDPCQWMRGFAIESETELDARRERRRRLRESIVAFGERYQLPAQTPDEIAAMIHENRESRAGSLIQNARRVVDPTAEGAGA